MPERHFFRQRTASVSLLRTIIVFASTKQETCAQMITIVPSKFNVYLVSLSIIGCLRYMH